MQDYLRRYNVELKHPSGNQAPASASKGFLDFIDMMRACKTATEFAHAMKVNHLLLHKLHQQLLQQPPGYILHCLSSQIMQLGHLQFHKQADKMRRQEVHAVSCLTAAHLQMHRLLPQELTSFSGYQKLHWLSEASVAITCFSGFSSSQSRNAYQIEKRHPCTGSLNREMSGDSNVSTV